MPVPRSTVAAPVVLLALLAALLAGPARAADAAATAALAADAKAMDKALAAWESLALVPRSDWVNVRTDLMTPAVGDGKADDTAALQAACAMFNDRQTHPRILYFPPGEYRITDTLTLTEIQGGAMIGHGRASRIVWDGPDGGRMVHSNGFGRCRWYGLLFDGRARAAVGVDHDSKTYYETRVRYEYCAFRDFTESGIRVGHDQKVASAEMMFMDCLFERCARGISFLAFNDYDNSIERCVFRDCGSAIHCYRGNVYVRDCHFAGSREEDVLLPPHSHSLRRCTSVGSAAFVRPAQPGIFPLLLAIQDCYVTGWRDAGGAVQLANRGPLLVFDSTCAAPASRSPALAISGPEMDRTLILANVQTVGCETFPDRGDARVIEVRREGRDRLLPERAEHRWRARPWLPRQVFDARRDFGAVGDGRADDSDALQRTIDAARAAGRGAMAYIPVGEYRLSRTLDVGAGDYGVGGTLCWRSILRWDGPAGGTMVHADQPDGVRLVQLRFEAPKEMAATSVRVTAAAPGRFFADGLWAGGAWQPEFAGVVFENLPRRFAVRAPHLDGDLRILGCGAARILVDNWYAGYAGPLLVRGQAGRGGLLGFNTAVASNCDPDLTVEDSGSIVIGDFYSEQTTRHLVVAGKPGQRPGRVTIANAKVHTEKTTDRFVIRGYRGLVTISRANSMYGPTQFVAKDAPDATLLLLGNAFNPTPPGYDFGRTQHLAFGNLVWNFEDRSLNQPLPDSRLDARATDALNAALDHFRDLSRLNLEEF